MLSNLCAGKPEAAEISPHIAKLLRSRGHDLCKLGGELQHDLQSRLDAFSDMSCAQSLAKRSAASLIVVFKHIP